MRPRARAMAAQFLSRLAGGEEIDSLLRPLSKLRPGLFHLFVGEAQGLFLEKRFDVPVTDPEFSRAGGMALCRFCGRCFRDHPPAFEHLGYDGLPCLTRLCDGSLVKL